MKQIILTEEQAMMLLDFLEWEPIYVQVDITLREVLENLKEQLK